MNRIDRCFLYAVAFLFTRAFCTNHVPARTTAPIYRFETRGIKETPATKAGFVHTICRWSQSRLLSAPMQSIPTSAVANAKITRKINNGVDGPPGYKHQYFRFSAKMYGTRYAANQAKRPQRPSSSDRLAIPESGKGCQGNAAWVISATIRNRTRTNGRPVEAHPASLKQEQETVAWII